MMFKKNSYDALSETGGDDDACFCHAQSILAGVYDDVYEGFPVIKAAGGEP